MKRVPDNMRLGDYHMLGSHNSYCTPEYFKIVYQNSYSIRKQLDLGIRAITLDVYEFKDHWLAKRTDSSDLILSHGTPGWKAFSQKGFTCGGIMYQTLTDAIQQVADFLEDNPDEIVWVMLERYVHLWQIEDELRPWQHLIYKNNQDNNPRFAELRRHNTRLIVSSDRGSEFIWRTWNLCFENQFGIVKDIPALLQPRFNMNYPDSNLSICNHFWWFPVTALMAMIRSYHDIDFVKHLYQEWRNKYGSTPRVYMGDRLDELVESNSDLIDYMNRLNGV